MLKEAYRIKIYEKNKNFENFWGKKKKLKKSFFFVLKIVQPSPGMRHNQKLGLVQRCVKVVISP